MHSPNRSNAIKHWRTLDGYLAHSRVRRLLLTGALNQRAKRIALAEIAGGQADIVVGTPYRANIAGSAALIRALLDAGELDD